MKTKQVLLTWPELTGQLADLDKRDNALRAEGSSKASRTGDPSFTGTHSLGHAVELLRNGWQDGTDAIAEGLDAITAETAEDGPSWELDVAGAFPCVPALMSGAPETMWQVQDSGERRRLYLAFDVCYSSSVAASCVTAYAKALAATVRTLEASGIEVSLLAADSGRSRSAAGYPFGRLCTLTWVKREGEPLDLGRIAMAGHPSFLRRAMFGFREMQADIPTDLRSCGYGKVEATKAEDVAEMVGDVGGQFVTLPRIQDVCPSGSTDPAYYSRKMAAAIKLAAEG